MTETNDPTRVLDWAYADRANFTARWNRANVLNLLRPSNGFEEYRTIGQRAEFYNWFDQIREAQGHETLWPAAAMIVATQMRSLEDPFRTLAMTLRRAVSLRFETSEALIAFGERGNKMIFDDVFPKLGDLYRQGLAGNPLKGEAAASWDRATLHHEQFDVVQPIYVQAVHANPELRDELEDMAAGHDVFWLGGVAIGSRLDFTGDILSAQDRYNHGMNVVVPFYKQFKAALDSGRRRSQVAKPDPAAGGMVSIHT